jgi:AraC family transcriptional regulator
MQRMEKATDTRQGSRYPNQLRRILGELETHAVKVREMEYAAGLCIGRHSHNTANLIYIVAGAHWSGYSRGGDTCPPHTVRYIAPGELHENYFPVGSRCLNIELRRPILDLATQYGHTIKVAGEVARPSAPLLGARLHREFCQKDDLSPLGIELAILQLIAADSQGFSHRRERIPAWLLRVREMLREEGNGRSSLAGLSRCVGRHPVQISRQFHQYFGCTISEYVRRVRVARAQALLARGKLEVSEIALACGFYDQSHFTCAFRRLTGVSPHRYRLQTRGRL